MSLIVISGFVNYFYFLVSSHVWSYCSYLLASESTLSMMLNKLPLEGVYTNSPLFGRIGISFFFLTCTVTLIAMFITVINATVEMIRSDCRWQEDDLEVLAFAWNKVYGNNPFSFGMEQKMKLSTNKNVHDCGYLDLFVCCHFS